MDFWERYELVEVREVGETARVPGIRSERADVVAKWFGIEKFVGEKDETASGPVSYTGIVPNMGKIVLVMGASGAGKSSLLRGMRAERKDVQWVDLNEVGLPEVPIVDCFGEMRLEEVLGVLSRVGLGEAWSYLRFPSELSEGQRWRLKLAVGMSASAKPPFEFPQGLRQAARRGNQKILVADEFGAVLDRVTAGIVARCLRRAIDGGEGLGAVVASSHEDLVGALLADVVVRCDFRRVEVWRKLRVACC